MEPKIEFFNENKSWFGALINIDYIVEFDSEGYYEAMQFLKVETEDKRLTPEQISTFKRLFRRRVYEQYNKTRED